MRDVLGIVCRVPVGLFAMNNGLAGGVCAVVPTADGDGWLDICVSVGSGNSVVWMQNSGVSPTPTFTQQLIYGSASSARFVAAADLDKDGECTTTRKWRYRHRHTHTHAHSHTRVHKDTRTRTYNTQTHTNTHKHTRTYNTYAHMHADTYTRPQHIHAYAHTVCYSSYYIMLRDRARRRDRLLRRCARVNPCRLSGDVDVLSASQGDGIVQVGVSPHAPNP